MKITQIHTNKPQSLSFEIFPPKKEEDFKNIDEMPPAPNVTLMYSG
jgi:methylenetetrahydrofolate reductase (NADPH)